MQYIIRKKTTIYFGPYTFILFFAEAHTIISYHIALSEGCKPY